MILSPLALPILIPVFGRDAVVLHDLEAVHGEVTAQEGVGGVEVDEQHHLCEGEQLEERAAAKRTLKKAN